MKYLLITLITFYQKFLSVMIKSLLGIGSSCRFNPTCSSYAKNSIKEYGVIKGGGLALARLFKCQPFYKLSV